MASLIETANHPDRKYIAHKVEYIQNKVRYLYRHFGDETLAFKAGHLAWEALRLFWYAVKHESDGGKLVEVERALEAVRQQVEVNT